MTRTTVAVLFLGIWLACCAGKTPEVVNVTGAESGQSLGLVVGQELIVTLTSNASTGFAWSIHATPADVLRVVGESEYIPDQPVLPGSGGKERFRLEAVRTGRTTVRFEYRQPWDVVSPALRTVTYSVVVQR